MTVTTHGPGRDLTGVVQERPWGSWEVLDAGVGYKVKRLSVRPHSRLSLQVHRHRSEHWLVVSGLATCLLGDRTLTAGPGGHVFVPRGAVHRLANEQHSPLLVVELQLGAHLQEDDIVRLEDDHGRARSRQAPGRAQ